MKFIAIIFWWLICIGIVIPFHILYYRVFITLIAFLWDGTVLNLYWGGITYEVTELVIKDDTWYHEKREENKPYSHLFTFWRKGKENE